MSEPPASSVLDFFLLCGNLKASRREWHLAASWPTIKFTRTHAHKHVRMRTREELECSPVHSGVGRLLIRMCVVRPYGTPQRTQRTGWVHNKVKDPESIADHMHRMSVMGMLCDDPNLDRTR